MSGSAKRSELAPHGRPQPSTAADVFAALGMDELDETELWTAVEPLLPVGAVLAPGWTAILNDALARRHGR
jgi:hypothetical protein